MRIAGIEMFEMFEGFGMFEVFLKPERV